MPEDCGCDGFSAEEQVFAALLAEDDAPEVEYLGPDERGGKVRVFRDQLIAPYGKPTGDKRRFAEGALTVGDLPIGLKWQRADNQGHSTSVTVGAIHNVRFADDGVYASGVVFDPDPEKTARWAEDCAEAYGLLKEKVIGPSVDLDSMDFHEYVDDGEEYSAEARPEIEVERGRIRAVTLVTIPAFVEARPFALDEVDADDYAAQQEATAALTAAGVPDYSEEMPVDVFSEWDPAGWLDRAGFLDGAALYASAAGPLFPVADLLDGELRLMPAAVADAVSVLAFKSHLLDIPDGVQATLRARLDDLTAYCGLPAPPWQGRSNSLTASGWSDWTPDAASFEDPKLDKLTPLTVKDGRVFGHLASWKSCHIGFKHCVKAPASRSNYAYFHVGEINTTAGPVAVGKITLGGGHASTAPGVTYQAAAQHYDDAGAAVAAVRAGEDKYGIWVSGVALPGKEDEFASLPLFPLSGDWRSVGGRMELVAALAVNTPGFGITRVSEQSGRVNALVAAGVVEPEGEFRDVGSKERDKLAGKGFANPDGSFPIKTVADLENAIQAYGRAKNKQATKSLIMRRAKALKRPDLIPDDWQDSSFATDTEILHHARQEWLAMEAARAFGYAVGPTAEFHLQFMEELFATADDSDMAGDAPWMKKRKKKKGQPVDPDDDHDYDYATRTVVEGLAELDALTGREAALKAASAF